MNIWENTVLTDKGKALQAKLLNGQTLKIRRVATGAKKVPVVDLRQQINVSEGGYDIDLQPVRTEGEKTIIPVLLENKDLKESYELWQVGFYAEDPDEGEILFCLAQAAQAKNIPSEAESPGYSITWNFYFNTANDVPFEVVLNPVGLVNIEAYQVHTEKIKKINEEIERINVDFSEVNTEISTTNSSINTLKSDINATNNTVNARLNALESDTGWRKVIGTGIAGVSIVRPSAGDEIMYRKKNGIVYIHGSFGIDRSYAGGSTTENKAVSIFTLPAGFHPGRHLYCINTGTGAVLTRYYLNASGAVMLEWMRNVADGTIVKGTVNWIELIISFPAA